MAETVRIENDGIGLNVEIGGPDDGPLVVFLHGVTSSARTWAWLPEEVTRGRRIARLDFRGHGESEHAPTTYDLPHYGADVVAVLRELSTGPAVLVGHSLGGAVAWWVAQQHPELVAAALLEDPPLLVESGSLPEGFRLPFEAMRANAAAAQEAGLSAGELAERIGAMTMGPPGAPPLREVMTEDGLDAMGYGHSRMDLGVIDGAIDGTTLAASDATSPVEPPVVVLAADEMLGAAFETAHAEQLARTHPAVQTMRMSGAGHGIHDERRNRDAFVGELRRFLDEHAPTGA